MPIADPLMTAVAALWAAFVVYRLETLRQNHRELWERVLALEQALTDDGNN